LLLLLAISPDSDTESLRDMHHHKPMVMPRSGSAISSSDDGVASVGCLGNDYACKPPAQLRWVWNRHVEYDDSHRWRLGYVCTSNASNASRARKPDVVHPPSLDTRTFLKCLRSYTACTGERWGAKVLFYGDSVLRGSYEDLGWSVHDGTYFNARAGIEKMGDVAWSFSRQVLSDPHTGARHHFDYVQRTSFGLGHVATGPARYKDPRYVYVYKGTQVRVLHWCGCWTRADVTDGTGPSCMIIRKRCPSSLPL
jgi:hypothetical protein